MEKPDRVLKLSIKAKGKCTISLQSLNEETYFQGSLCAILQNLTIIWLLGFPDNSVGKESTCNVGDLGSIPGLGRSPGEGKGCPLQHFGMENSMDCTVNGVAKSRTRLSDFHFQRNKTFVEPHCYAVV